MVLLREDVYLIACGSFSGWALITKRVSGGKATVNVMEAKAPVIKRSGEHAEADINNTFSFFLLAYSV